MNFFKINYNKLENMKEIKFYKLILIIIIIFIVLIVISLKIEISKKFQCYGLYYDNILSLKINSELSDKLKKSEYIIFKNQKNNFEIKEYGNYEILNNEVYQEINLIVDNKFYDNEVGLVEFYYDKKSVFKYILDLFK